MTDNVATPTKIMDQDQDYSRPVYVEEKSNEMPFEMTDSKNKTPGDNSLSQISKEERKIVRKEILPPDPKS